MDGLGDRELLNTPEASPFQTITDLSILTETLEASEVCGSKARTRRVMFCQYPFLLSYKEKHQTLRMQGDNLLVDIKHCLLCYEGYETENILLLNEEEEIECVFQHEEK